MKKTIKAVPQALKPTRQKELKNFSLGEAQTEYPTTYAPQVLEAFDNKSLKLYLYSFRNHGDFHEDCIQKICDDLVKLMKPHYIEVVGEFTPRGGIAIFPYANYACENKKYQNIKESRILNYAPGKYSMELSKLY